MKRRRGGGGRGGKNLKDDEGRARGDLGLGGL